MYYFYRKAVVLVSVTFGFYQHWHFHKYLANRDCVEHTIFKFSMWGHCWSRKEVKIIDDKSSEIYIECKKSHDRDVEYEARLKRLYASNDPKDIKIRKRLYGVAYSN